MKKHKFFNIFWLLTLFSVILTGCGGGGGSGGDGVTLNYIPNFKFDNSSSAALTYGSEDWDDEQRQRYIMFSPFLIGFIKSPQTINNGKVYSFALQNSSSNLGLTASVSGSVVTFTGTVPNNSGYVTIAINTANNTFDYEQLLRVQAGSTSDSLFAVIYIKLTDVQLKENGYYQTRGKAYVLGTVPQCCFLGEMEYYFGKGQTDHPYSDDTHVVIGTYGVQRLLVSAPSLSRSDLESISSTQVISNFSESNLQLASNPMIIYYDKTDGQFYITGEPNPAFGEEIRKLSVDGTDGPKQPWTLLP